MMTRWMKTSWLAGLAATGALTLGLTGFSPAQSQGERTQSTFTIPPAQELLRIEVDTPEQVRVNNDFEYSIRVTNTSDDVVLHDVRIAQKAQKGFEIESAQVQKKDQQQGNQQQGNQQQGNQQQGNQQQGNQQQSADQQKGQNEKQSQDEKKSQSDSKQKGQSEKKSQGDSQQKGREDASQNDQKQSQSKGKSEWTISQLEPGETRTIRVKASSENEGEQQMCLMVKSFTPALCLTTTFTRPELKVALDLPEKANVCEPFDIEYYIKNTGTGAVETLTVKSDLPDGLTLEDGSKKINFEVDGLDPEEVRKFVATVMASKAGSYSTRGVVTAPGGLKARSKKWSVDVRAADLAVAIDGPGRVHIDREATYTVRVSNNGDAPARDTSLMLQFPQTADLVSTGEIRESDQNVASSGNQSGSGETRTAAYRGAGSGQDKQESGDQKQQDQKQQDQEKSEPADEQWNLGDLKPGQTREVEVTLRPEEARKMQIEAVAVHLCGGKEKSEKIRSTAATM
ncbi:MAG: hypothetical protein ACF8TS_00010, partial [Maioricimonas sp. JB049]